MNKGFNISEFEDAWRNLSIEISQAIYVIPEIQGLKNSLQANGFLSLEEKSQFIDLCNKTKYKVIQKKYGQEGTEGYYKFSEDWKAWFQSKGVESAHSKGQRDSVEHIMFGSTPDPEKFLLNFEHEVLGSFKTE
jgi:hypothetical protein